MRSSSCSPLSQEALFLSYHPFVCEPDRGPPTTRPGRSPSTRDTGARPPPRRSLSCAARPPPRYRSTDHATVLGWIRNVLFVYVEDLHVAVGETMGPLFTSRGGECQRKRPPGSSMNGC